MEKFEVIRRIETSLLREVKFGYVENSEEFSSGKLLGLESQVQNKKWEVDIKKGGVELTYSFEGDAGAFIFTKEEWKEILCDFKKAYHVLIHNRLDRCIDLEWEVDALKNENKFLKEELERRDLESIYRLDQLRCELS